MKKHKQIQLGEIVFLMLLYGVPIKAKDKKRPMWWKNNSIQAQCTITVYQWWEYINKSPNNSMVLLRKRYNEKRSRCYKEIWCYMPVDAILSSQRVSPPLNSLGVLKRFVCSIIKYITISGKHELQYIKWMSAVPLMIISFCAAERNTAGLHSKQLQPPFCSL